VQTLSATLFFIALSPLSLSADMRALALLALLSVSDATELTKETWDGAVAGKSVFVKFLAPW